MPALWRSLVGALLLLSVFSIFFAVPSFAQAQSTSVPNILQGPLVPCGVSGVTGTTIPSGYGDPCQACHLGKLAQNLVLFLIAVTAFIATVLFAWAGVLYLFSQGDPGKIQKAHQIFVNVLIGFILVLAAWIIVNTIIVTLASAPGTTGGTWSNWFEIKCVAQPTKTAVPSGNMGSTGEYGVGQGGSVSCPTGTVRAGEAGCADTVNNQFVLPLGYTCPVDSFFDGNSGGCQYDDGLYTNAIPPGGAGGTGGYGQTTGTGSGAQCSTNNSACSVSALQTVGYTQTQANVMSCIAVTESTGNPNTANNPKSGACGTFQFVPGTWSTIQKNVSACSSASCSDANCAMQGAWYLSQSRMSRGQSPYADWTCTGCNPKANECQRLYDPASV